MAEPLPPASAPKHDGRENSSNKELGQRSAGNRRKNVAPENRNVGVKAKPSHVAANIFVGVLEALAFVFWQLADGFAGYACGFVHWLSISSGLAGATIVIDRTAKSPKLVWSIFGLVCCVVGVVEFENFRPSSETPPAAQAAQPALPFSSSASPTNIPRLPNSSLVSTGASALNKETSNITIGTLNLGVPGWEPPEIPHDCRTVTITVGDKDFTMTNKPGHMAILIGVDDTTTPMSSSWVFAILEHNRLAISVVVTLGDYLLLSLVDICPQTCYSSQVMKQMHQHFTAVTAWYWFYFSQPCLRAVC
jgi:hypothetical protein